MCSILPDTLFLKKAALQNGIKRYKDESNFKEKYGYIYIYIYGLILSFNF